MPTVIAALVTEPEEAGSSRWYTDRKFTISITAFLLILPLSIPKEIGFQKYARWVGEPCRTGGVVWRQWVTAPGVFLGGREERGLSRLEGSGWPRMCRQRDGAGNVGRRPSDILGAGRWDADGLLSPPAAL